MTSKEIEKRAQKEMLPYTAAKQIREILDNVKRLYGEQDWEDSYIDDKIQELVFGD